MVRLGLDAVRLLRLAARAGTQEFEAHFPADYICEALDQTRGWFYSMLAVSTLLFDQSSYRNVVCLGLILDENGQKMSKSKGNIIEPWDVLNTYGADALRWYFFTSKYPWDGYRFSMEALGEAVRQFMLQLWNTYGFYVLYANANGVGQRSLSLDQVELTELDRWALSRLNATIETVRDGLEAFDATGSRPGDRRVRRRALQLVRAPFAPALLGRRAGGDGDPAPLADDASQAAGAVHPVHRRRDLREPRRRGAQRAPVRLPGRRRARRRARGRDGVARETVRLGLAARSQAKVKLRQPLHAAVVVAAGDEREAIERLAEIVRDELNVRELRFVSEADELGEVEIKANYRTLGPRFGKQMPMVAAAVAGLDPGPRRRDAARGRHGGDRRRRNRARARRRGPARLDEAAGGLPGRARGLARRRARARDRRVAARRGLGAGDRARRPGGAPRAGLRHLRPDHAEARRRRALLDAAREHEEYIAGEVLAVVVEYGSVEVRGRCRSTGSSCGSRSGGSRACRPRS